MARIELSLSTKVAALRSQLRLLEQHHRRAFADNNDDYLGEVAGKIRLLAFARGRNKPLLLDLMKEFGFTYEFTLDGPPVAVAPGELGPGSRVSLTQYLDSTSFKIREPNTQELKTVTIIEHVTNFANQFGSAHQDAAIDLTSVGHGYATHIFGQDLIRQQLQIVSNIIIASGRAFDKFLTPSKVDEKVVEIGLPDKPVASHFADRAAAFVRLKCAQDAMDCCNEGLARYPNTTLLELMHAQAFVALEQYPAALRIYDEIVESGLLVFASPEHSYLAHYNRACMQMRANRPEDSLESLRIAGQFGNLSIALTDTELAVLKYDPEYQGQLHQIVSDSQNSSKLDVSVAQ